MDLPNNKNTKFGSVNNNIITLKSFLGFKTEPSYSKK
jgi:hypothetical protein